MSRVETQKLIQQSCLEFVRYSTFALRVIGSFHCLLNLSSWSLFLSLTLTSSFELKCLSLTCDHVLSVTTFWVQVPFLITMEGGFATLLAWA